MNQPITATYGHGTENDFVIFFDPDDSLEISPLIVAALCNRTSGIGADGVIRIVRQDKRWFMDYRNADGSIAEMCGNGIRVMAPISWREVISLKAFSLLILEMDSST